MYEAGIFILYCQLLEQCLTHNRCPRNICGMIAWRRNELAHFIVEDTESQKGCLEPSLLTPSPVLFCWAIFSPPSSISRTAMLNLWVWASRAPLGEFPSLGWWLWNWQLPPGICTELMVRACTHLLSAYSMLDTGLSRLDGFISYLNLTASWGGGTVISPTLQTRKWRDFIWAKWKRLITSRISENVGKLALLSYYDFCVKRYNLLEK